MPTISLCMIVKNEEDVLARCLDSVGHFADEIIIVDTGSTDRTREIALSYTDKVYDFEWVDHFAAARNFAFSHAAMDYCMWLDADDVLLPEDLGKMTTLKKTMTPDTDVVMIRYNVGFDGKGNPSFSFFRERIVRNHPNYRWIGAVHEVIEPMGKIVHWEAAVTHRKIHEGDSDRNLRIYEKELKSGARLDSRHQFYYARELLDHDRHAEALPVLLNFLDEGKGWVENNIEACRRLAACYLHEKAHGPALAALFRSFQYDVPRAEICCDIGEAFMTEKAFRQAIFWYELALTRPRNDYSGGFVLPECYGYIPAIQLCVCYYQIGEMARSRQYNELAGQYKPDSPEYLRNRAFFGQSAKPET